MSTRSYIVTIAGQERTVEVVAKTPGRSYQITVDGTPHDVEAVDNGSGGRALIFDGQQRLTFSRKAGEGRFEVQAAGAQAVAEVSDPRWRNLPKAATGGGAAAAGETIASPMPGKVVKVLVEQGDEVVAGQGVIVVEAMKMENELRAAKGGVVIEIKGKAGDAVSGQQALVVLGPKPE